MSIKVSPSFANYGFNPRMGVEPNRQIKVEAVDDFTKQMKFIHEEAQVALTKAKEEMECYVDYHQGDPPKHQVGQKVWLEIENLNISQLSKKLAEKHIRPYSILEIKSPNAVHLKLLWSIKIHLVVNVLHICPYIETCILQQTITALPPVKIKGEFEYKVKQILDSRLYQGKLQYLVKWLGYMEEHNTWEPLSNLSNAQEVIKLFHKTHPSAPQNIYTLQHFWFHPIKNLTQTPEGLSSALNHNDECMKNGMKQPFHEDANTKK